MVIYLNYMTKFEEDLKTYFPDIYELNILGKNDPNVWEIFHAMLEMRNKDSFGSIEIKYQGGKINHIVKAVFIQKKAP